MKPPVSSSWTDGRAGNYKITEKIRLELFRLLISGMEKISLKTSSNFRTNRDIETALAWNAIKKALQNLGKDELFKYIESIKITEKYIILKTGKPLINQEFKFLEEKILYFVRENSHLT